MQQYMQTFVRMLIASICGVALSAQAAQLAGKVTAALGEAQIVQATAGERAAVEGALLHVGDILQTGAGGHIHLRMVDGGLVSLRPDSKLKITSYTYQPGVPDATQIRLDLLHGTVRSVTGKGGELAKDRFRINTPIAAIGVRGTDFVTQTSDDKTLVHVAIGAIVLAPFGDGCLSGALGVCQTAGARLLTAEMSNMMLQMTRGMTEPQLVPLNNKLKTSDPQAAVGNPIWSQMSGQASDNTVDIILSDTALQKKMQDSLAALPATPVGQPNITPPPVSSTHYQLVWGSWGSGTPGNDLNLPFQDAVKDREVTVGNGMNGLFRDNSGPLALPQSGRTEFVLRSASVSMPTAAGEMAGQVQRGTLGVDFNTQKFDTRLDITHSQLPGPVALVATGTINSNGILLYTPSGSNGFVAGALSRNGSEAGYLFSLRNPAGTLSGTTLWVK